ncbi:MAG TPA: hypothetical protein VI756_18255 [Blastocatellia bacterium]
MSIWLLILFSVAAAAVGVFLVGRYLKARREDRMDTNEYNTAVALWEFSRTVKSRLADVKTGNTAVIDFSTLSMPKGPGYRLSLELTCSGFSIWAVPRRYGRTGRLSFYVGNAASVRAMDRAGGPAEAGDPEYV